MNINRYSKAVLLFFATTLSGILYSQNRSYDGSGNNIHSPEWGATGSTIRNLLPFAYADLVSSPTGENRPNPRLISNELFSQTNSIKDGHSLSDFTWAFALFLEHEISHFAINPLEPFPIEVPECDPAFDANCTGSVKINLNRSTAADGTGLDMERPRSVANLATAYLDGSAIYGSDVERANWLRTFRNGKLKVSSGNLLPFNTLNGELNGTTDPAAPYMQVVDVAGNRYFVAGDSRANENVMLTALHTLFVREHNRLCDSLAFSYPTASDEEIYQRARKMVGGILQNVVYQEWLPAMGVSIPSYTGYKPEVNVNVSNEFSAAALRIGPTLYGNTLLRMENDCRIWRQGDLTMQKAFANPITVLASGIEPLLKGMSAQIQQEFDCKVRDEIRNLRINQTILDPVAISIQRGRERGLPSYAELRKGLGLGIIRSFNELTPDGAVARVMEDLYGTLDEVDPWVGLLAEKHIPGAMFGETTMALFMEQFRALRDGDRFYFEIDPSLSEIERSEIRSSTLARLIERNTTINTMQKNVFVMELECEISYVPQQHLALSVVPNPVESLANVFVYSFENKTGRMTIADIHGKVLRDQVISLSKGENHFSLELETGWMPGLYLVQVTQGEEMNTYKMLKAR